MEFVQKFTLPDFQAKNFTPSISPNFNGFSKKKHKKWVKMEKFTPLAKILHCRRQWRHWQIPPLPTCWHKVHIPLFQEQVSPRVVQKCICDLSPAVNSGKLETQSQELEVLAKNEDGLNPANCSITALSTFQKIFTYWWQLSPRNWESESCFVELEKWKWKNLHLLATVEPKGNFFLLSARLSRSPASPFTS